MKYLKFNLNDNVYAKLTEIGKETFIKKFRTLTSSYYPEEFLLQYEKDAAIVLESKTKNGYTRFQAHDFMHLYGPQLTGSYNPKGMPFATDVYFEAHDSLVQEIPIPQLV
jgi:hypothetical protein